MRDSFWFFLGWTSGIGMVAVLFLAVEAPSTPVKEGE